MHIRCVGSGATTVVLIGGFNDDGDNWGAIEAPLARDARVCSSARLGTGTSDPPTSVQTFTTQATQLARRARSGRRARTIRPCRPLLRRRRGGCARRCSLTESRPRADRRHADHLARTACTVPDDGSDVARSFVDSCTIYFHPDGNPERLDVPAAFTEVATITSLGQLPMVVVTADTKAYDGLDAGEAAPPQRRVERRPTAMAALSSVGQVVTVANTSHNIHLDQPAIVVEQIQNLAR